MTYIARKYAGRLVTTTVTTVLSWFLPRAATPLPDDPPAPTANWS